MKAETGQIILTGGNHGATAQEGTWAGVAGGAISVDAGSYVWGSGAELEGTVYLAGGSVQSGDIQAPHAELVLYGGGSELDLTDGSTASHLGSLSVRSGTALTGVGAVDVSEALSWTGGTMSGSGATVLESGASGSINPGSGSSVALTERMLTNHGSLTWSTGSVEGRSDAEINNSGIFETDADVSGGSYPYYGLLNKDGSNVWVHNTGTIKKSAGSEFTQIQFQIDNEGTVEAKTGQIIFTGGSYGGTEAAGTWTAETASISFNSGSYAWGAGVHFVGQIVNDGVSFQAPDIQGSGAVLYLYTSGSTLTLTDASTASHIGTLNMVSGTTVTGAGTLNITEALSWNGGTMLGSGKTVLESGATGSIDPGSGSSVTLTERELTNEGTLTLSSGSVEGRSDAEIDNGGTLIVNSQAPGYEWWEHGLLNSDGSDVWLENTGTVKKASGGEFSQIQFQVDNEGTVDVETGQIIFSGGSHGSNAASGSWESKGGGQVSFNVGSYLLGPDVHMSGEVFLAGGNVQVGDIQAPDATLQLWGGGSTLTMTDTSTLSHLEALNIHSETTLTGAGSVEVSKVLAWDGNSTMSGTGLTVLGSSATGSIEASSGCEPMSLTKRQLVNEGSVTFGWGTFYMSEGARLDNKGTFKDNSEASCEGAQIQDPSGSGAAPSILNTGAFEKTAGGGTSTVAVNFSNQGAVEAKTGTLDFSDGGIPGEVAAGSWAVQSGAHIVLSGGTFLIDEEVDLSAVTIAGATVEQVPISGAPHGYMYALPYAAHTVILSGYGYSVGTGFSSASIELTAAGTEEWKAFCGPLTPSLVGEFSCSWNTASGSYPDGTYKVRAQLSDSSEPPNVGPTPAITVLVDNTPPTGTVGATTYLEGTEALVSGTAEDGGSGIESWQLQITPAGKAEWANACSAQTKPVSGSTYRCGVNSTGDTDGAYELQAIITDNAGNQYTTGAVDTTVDNTPPTGTLARVTEAAYVKGSLSLEGTAGDSKSGVASWAPQIAPAGSSSWTNACSPQTTPISGSTYGCSLNTAALTDGEYQIRAQIQNNAGGIYDTSTQSFTTDNTPPVGSLDELERTSKGTIDVKGPAFDAASGVASWQLLIRRTTSTTWEDACPEQVGPSEGLEIYGCSVNTTGLADGSYQLHAVITDNVGNTYTTRPVATRIDNAEEGGSETGCTVTWTGEAGGSWQTSSNWSTGSVPGSSDRACIPTEASVQVSSGTNQVGSITGEGTITITGGTLELADGSTVSEINTLNMQGGTLSGPSTLDVFGSFTGVGAGHPTIATGLVLASGTTSTIDGAGCGSGGGDFFLNGADFVNEGSLTFGQSGGGANGDIVMSEGAQLQNDGTLEVDSWSNDVGPCNHTWYSLYDSAGGASITNTGVFKVGVGSGNTLLSNVHFSNSGTVTVQSGTLTPTDGISGGTWTTTGGGVISPSGNSVAISNVDASGAAFAVSNGTLSVPSGTTSTIGTLSLSGGSLSIAGGLDVSGSLSGSYDPTISGSGTLVIKPGATGAVNSAACGSGGGDFSLSGVDFVNEGSLVVGAEGGGADGDIVMSEGAQLHNGGTLEDDSLSNDVGACNHTWYSFYHGSGGAGIFNTGVFKVGVGSGNTLLSNVPLINSGTVTVQSGTFTPESGASGGTWTTTGEGVIGTAGRSVSLSNLSASEATIAVSNGTLSFPSGTKSTVGHISLSGGTLGVNGELDVSGSFVGVGGGDPTISGSGSLVVKPTATGTVDNAVCGSGGGDFSLSGVDFVNEGSLIFGAEGGGADGDVVMSEGAQLHNNGTLEADSWSNDVGACNHTWYSFYNGSGSASIVNTGTFKVGVGSGNTLLSNVPLTNSGTVTVQSGTLTPESGASGGTWTTTGGGAIGPAGRSASLSNVDASDAMFDVGSGTLTLPSGTTSTVGEVLLTGGTLSVDGELDVLGSLVGVGGGNPTINGPGSLVIRSGATGAIDGAGCSSGGGDFFLSSVDFVNEGSLTFGTTGGGADGDIVMSEGAQLHNSGMLEADSWSNDVGPCNHTWYSFYKSSGSASITNTGTLDVGVGSGNALLSNVPFNNEGTVRVQGGAANFSGGGIPEQVAKGSWLPDNGTGIVLSGGTFTVEEGSKFFVEMDGATVVWVPRTVKGYLDALSSYTAGTTTVTGSGEGDLAGPLASATIEVASAGSGTWKSLCGPLTPGMGGVFECSWETGSGPYPDGHYELRAKLRNEASSPETVVTPPISTFVDNTTPTGTLTEPSHSVGGSQLIAGTASDAGSGLQSWQLQIEAEGSSEWKEACAAQTVPITGNTYGCTIATGLYTNGAYHLRSVITDEAGNAYTTSSVNLHIDNATPTGTLGSLPPYLTKTVELTGTAASSGSAVASWAVQVAPVETNSWSSACPAQSIPRSGSEYSCEMDTAGLAEGEYELRVVVTDVEGDTYATAPVKAIVDNYGPTGSLFAPPEHVAGTVEVRGYAYDAQSEVASWALQIAPAGSETFGSLLDTDAADLGPDLRLQSRHQRTHRRLIQAARGDDRRRRKHLHDADRLNDGRKLHGPVQRYCSDDLRGNGRGRGVERQSGHVERWRYDRLHLPVAGLQLIRRRMCEHRRCHWNWTTCWKPARWAKRCGSSSRRPTALNPTVLCLAASAVIEANAIANVSLPTISGSAHVGATPERRSWPLGWCGADLLRLPVAALQLLGRSMREHQRRDRPELQAPRRRRLEHAPSRRHRHQRRRIGEAPRRSPRRWSALGLARESATSTTKPGACTSSTIQAKAPPSMNGTRTGT